MSPRRFAPRRLLTTAAALLAAVLVLLSSAVPAQAAPEVFREKFSGLFVEGFAFSEQGECVVTSTNIRADKDTVEYGNYRFNQCTGKQLVAEFGSGSPTVFEVARKFRSARVVAEVPLIDTETGEPTDEVVSLDLTFTAAGPMVKERDFSSRKVTGEHTMKFRSIGRFVPATVTGLGPHVEFARIGRVSSTMTEIWYDPSKR